MDVKWRSERMAAAGGPAMSISRSRRCRGDGHLYKPGPDM